MSWSLRLIRILLFSQVIESHLSVTEICYLLCSTGTHHSVGSGSNHTGESSDDDIYENYTGATAAAAASDPTQEVSINS